MPNTWAGLVTEALQEISVLGSGQTASPEDALKGQQIANRILDSWNADRLAVYASVLTPYLLTIGLSPHTIGPTGATFTAPARPVDIEAASLLINSQRTQLRVRDEAWWQRQSTPAATGDPSDVAFVPSWPNGALYFWPVPTVARTVHLQTRVLLSSVSLTTAFDLPPGYWAALSLTLSEQIAPAFETEASAGTKAEAIKARARIFANNDRVLPLATAGFGTRAGAYFNMQTGRNE